MKKIFFLCMLVLCAQTNVWAQFDTNDPKTYILSGLVVEGAEYSDENAIIALSGLKLESPITLPGIQVSDAIKRLWKENIFSDIELRVDNISANKVFLVISVKERPRISQFSFQGISKSQADDLREKINFIRGTILTDSKKQSATRIIRNFYVEKGFYAVGVEIKEEKDKILKNGVVVNIIVDKKSRIKIDHLIINGDSAFTEKKIHRKLKKVHEKRWWRFWARSKYFPKQFEEAKGELITFYNDAGYRDAIIGSDTVYINKANPDKGVIVEVDLYEGRQYYHRNIAWAGNYKYDSEILKRALAINRGDIYSKSKIDQRLFGDPSGNDLSSLYLDDGYLFFNLDPVEVLVEGDSIDLEMRISEGPQATIRKIIIEGNTKTSDFVIRRELRTAPGQKFSRSDIIRSQREILALNYFDQENLGVQPKPNQQDGTVDIQYTVEERPSDQLQLQGGWGGRIRNSQGDIIAGGFVGTVQLAFNNFASKRMFEPGAWRPVPSGDGQRLSLSFQMNGVGYKNFSLSFIEPWLGGKKPTSLGLNASYLVYQNISSVDLYRNSIFNASIDLGRRLKFPDDFFTSRTSLGFKYYDILNPSSIFQGFEGEPSAYINIVTLRQSFDRSSVDAPIYPRSGSIISFSVEATPPYSVFGDDKDYTDISDAEKFKFLEYHKWRFNSNWFFRIVGDMVLSTKIEAGYLGGYNKKLGISPFERYFLGGSGLVGNGFWGLDGREIVALRGYPNNSITNDGKGYPIYNRFIMELRYPITLNQSAPVWVLGYLEAGNGFEDFRSYNPFNLKRAAGFGVRVMLPMVGLLGLDWGYGFDQLNQEEKSQFHFIIGQQF